MTFCSSVDLDVGGVGFICIGVLVDYKPIRSELNSLVIGRKSLLKESLWNPTQKLGGGTYRKGIFKGDSCFCQRLNMGEG